MYWVDNGDGTYELLDGQQRTISICSYLDGDYSINNMYFHNLTQGEKDDILNYPIMTYFCKGSDREKLDWFKTINISGEKLSDQELRNAMYTGTWLYDAKKYFSKNGCPAYQIANKLVNGTAIRQDYLETAIKWIADRDGCSSIEKYMSIHQHDKDADELWQYFNKVVNWVKIIYPNYRKEMKGIDWGFYYNRYGSKYLNSNDLEKKIVKLMLDDDVTKKKGIYEYLLDGQEKHLSIRAFTEKQKREAYERQKGVCASCGLHFDISKMEADHITPWVLGGRTVSDNCQMLCKSCNRSKGAK